MPMRLAIAAVAALLLPLSLAACSAAVPDPEPSDSREGNMPADVWTIAHRGAAAYAPENTIPAFTLGADQGATFVEIDLQRTKDGSLVVLHDVTLDRTTDVEQVFPDRARADRVGDDPEHHWWLEDFTLEELKELDAGSWFGPEFAGTRIPTFEETIAALRGRSGIFIELKSPERYAGIEAATMTVLEAHGLHVPGADPATPIVIQSFHVPSIEQLAAMGVKLPLHVLFSARDADRWFSEDGLRQIAGFATGISPEKPTLASHADGWQRAIALGLPLTPWTFRASRLDGFATVTDEMRHYLTAGATGVITDNPDLAP